MGRRRTRVLGLLAALGLLAGLARAEERPRGLLLVAAPGLADPNFRETVVLVARHGHGAPVGVVLNRPSPLTLGEALADHHARLRARTDPIFAGGPVAPATLVVVYRATESLGESLHVADDLYMSLAGTAFERVLGPEPGAAAFRIYAGYAGWAPGQLEREIQAGGWYVLPAEADVAFDAHPASLWRRLVERARQRRESI